MDSRFPQSVAIDGHKIRSIREEKRLTQLYVSKVVGVTTDTVSRWENNRYPTIRRENAVSLADALEVDLDDILKQDEPPEEKRDEVAEPPSTSVFFRLPVISGVIAIVLLLIGILWYQQSSKVLPSLTATRFVPAYAAPGSRILVHVRISSEVTLKGMILKETFPPGWQLIESVPVASSVDDYAGGARWIFRNPGHVVDLYYMLRVAKDNVSDEGVSIDGEVIVNPEGRHYLISSASERTMQLRAFHWSDQNGDSVIDDMEILDVSELLDVTESLNLEWDLIEAIWEAEAYRWDEETENFVPLTGSAT